MSIFKKKQQNHPTPADKSAPPVLHQPRVPATDPDPLAPNAPEGPKDAVTHGPYGPFAIPPK